MELTTTHDFPAAPGSVAQMMVEPAFWHAVADRAHALDHGVRVSGNTAELTLTIPAPDSVRAFVGSSLTLTQTTTLSPRADGDYDTSVDVAVAKVPVTMTATGSLTATPTGTTMRYVGDLVVKIPLVGKKIEREAEPFIVEALDTQAEVARDWLTR